MTFARRRGLRRRGLTVTVVAVALTVGAAPARAVRECAPIMPSASVARGMTGTGWTVVEGRTPEAFAARVLGVLPNEIGPGRDMIVIEATSPAIERAGGIWFGMSGSPVYVGDRLLGAIAYGFGTAAGPTSVVGLTAAEDMAKVLSYPVAPALGDAGTSDFRPTTVRLPASMVRRIAEATGTPVSEVSSTMTQLKIPLSVSGGGSRAVRLTQAYAKRRQLPVVAYGGASASLAPPPAAAAPEPGDNFAAVNAYGDVTIAAIGTTTYVCNGRALSFAHPFLFSGKTSTGANAAEALTIVRDPLLGPFKLATVAEGLGRVDQDRLGGLRTLLGEAALSTPIRSAVTAVDIGTTRNGATDVVLQEMTPFVTFLHVLSNIDSTFDAIGEGSSRVSWTIEGRRAGGPPWRLSRSNVYASGDDIAAASADEIAGQLDIIAANPFEEVRFTSVRLQASVEETVRLYTISRLLVSKNGGPYRARREIRARPGTRLGIRVVLTPFQRGAVRSLGMRFRVPRSARAMAAIEVSGGPEGGPPLCFQSDECEGAPAVDSFDRILRVLARHPRNNVLAARFRVGPHGRVRVRRDVPLDAVVRGRRMLFVQLPGGEGGGGVSPPADVVVVGEGGGG